MHLQALTCPRGRILAPQRVRQILARDDLPGPEREQREECARPLSPERHRLAIDDRLNRTEQLDPQLTGAVRIAGRHRMPSVSTPTLRPRGRRGNQAGPTAVR